MLETCARWSIALLRRLYEVRVRGRWVQSETRWEAVLSSTIQEQVCYGGLKDDGLVTANKMSCSEPFPFNVTTCTGIGDLTKAKIYSHGPQGMTVVDDHMEIACMQMNGR